MTDMLGEVVQCLYIDEITALVHPDSRFTFPGWQYPSNFAAANELQIDARNRAHDLGGNRVMARTRPFKGKQTFAVFTCSDRSLLRSYEFLVSARKNQELNLTRFCMLPGSPPPTDYQQYCITVTGPICNVRSNFDKEQRSTKANSGLSCGVPRAQIKSIQK